MKLVKVSSSYAMVDDEDYLDLIQFNWTIKTSKKENVEYAKRFVNKDGKYTTELMHRRIMKAKKGEEVDHENHNGLDNRRDNLRLCSFKENHQNRRRQKNSNSKFIGVGPQGKKFNARIWNDGKQVTIGTYETHIEAARAYDNMALKLRGKFAKLNFGATAPEPVEKENK